MKTPACRKQCSGRSTRGRPRRRRSRRPGRAPRSRACSPARTRDDASNVVVVEHVDPIVVLTVAAQLTRSLNGIDCVVPAWPTATGRSAVGEPDVLAAAPGRCSRPGCLVADVGDADVDPRRRRHPRRRPLVATYFTDPISLAARAVGVRRAERQVGRATGSAGCTTGTPAALRACGWAPRTR